MEYKFLERNLNEKYSNNQEINNCYEIPVALKFQNGEKTKK